MTDGLENGKIRGVASREHPHFSSTSGASTPSRTSLSVDRSLHDENGFTLHFNSLDLAGVITVIRRVLIS